MGPPFVLGASNPSFVGRLVILGVIGSLLSDGGGKEGNKGAGARATYLP